MIRIARSLQRTLLVGVRRPLIVRIEGLHVSCASLQPQYSHVKFPRHSSHGTADNVVKQVQKLAALPNPTHREVEAALGMLTSLRDSDATNIGRTLHALKGVRKGTRWVLLFYSKLASDVLPGSRGRFDAKSASMCMMSLKHRSSSDPEVRAFLSALAPHFESITAVSAQFVGNALYGLRGCSSEHFGSAIYPSGTGTADREMYRDTRRTGCRQCFVWSPGLQQRALRSAIHPPSAGSAYREMH